MNCAHDIMIRNDWHVVDGKKVNEMYCLTCNTEIEESGI